MGIWCCLTGSAAVPDGEGFGGSAEEGFLPRGFLAQLPGMGPSGERALRSEGPGFESQPCPLSASLSNSLNSSAL